MTTHTQPVSTETLLRVVAHPRRRSILHHLIENGDDAIELNELTETAATDGGNVEISHDPDNTRTRIELHHTHLPKLAEAGLIEYDAHDGTVRYLPTDRAEELLQFVSIHLE